jgi:hypothetical protein
VGCRFESCWDRQHFQLFRLDFSGNIPPVGAPYPRHAALQSPCAFFAGRSAPNRLFRDPMDNTSRRMPPNFRRGERSRSGREASPVLLLLSVVGISAAVFWATYGQLGAFSRAAIAQPAAQPQAQASDDATQSLEALRQSVKELQASQQHAADQLELVQRQLASEQGERKLLSEQVGALSGRVGGLSAPASSVTTGTAAQSPKRKPVLRAP